MDNPIRLFLINYYKKGGNMKNISGFLVAAAACVALSANAYAGDGSGFFVGASAEKYSTSSKILKAMPVKQIMPNGTPIHLELGWYMPASVNKMGAKAWLDFYSDSKRNSEKGVGLHGVAEWRLTDSLPVNFYFGGGTYMARQNSNGKSFTVDNPQSTLGYIVGMGNPSKGTITMTKNTLVIGLDVMAGFSFDLTRNFSMDIGYVGKYRRLSLGYRVNGVAGSDTNVNENAYDHSARLGLAFKF